MEQREESPRVAGVFGPANMNMGDCRNISWGEMWNRFKSVYEGRDRYSEAELRRMHVKWKRLTREIESGG